MKGHRSAVRAKRRRTTGPLRPSSAGRKAVSLAPPGYGIDFIDRPAGMPDGLKTGLERLSGIDLSDVRVHYDSPRPVQLHARAYTKGQDIYLAPGEERHLAHEGWHAVQQAQGRVPASGPVNEDRALEREADEMGARAQSAGRGVASAAAMRPPAAAGGNAVVQRVKWGNLALGALGTIGSLGFAWANQGFRNYMRDAWHGTVRLAEEDSETAQSGQIIRYTPLAAGCMAVTAMFNGGGGAGVHMAMMPQGANQWADFINTIGGNAVAQIFVDTEFVGEQQGWYVIPGGGGAPRSYFQLTAVDGLDDQQIFNAGWRYDTASVLNWFAQAFGLGLGAVQHTQDTTPWHIVP